MKHGIMDQAFNKAEVLLNATEIKLDQFAGTYPFRQRPMDTQEKVGMYNSLTQEDIMSLSEQFGEETTAKWLQKMHKLRDKNAIR